jgi:hypothetical protein
MAVSITQTPTQAFTWVASVWDWNDQRAIIRTWETATAYEWSVLEADAAPAFAPLVDKGVGKSFAEAFGTSSLYTDVASWALNASESLSFVETYTDLANWLNEVGESFDFAEAKDTSPSKALSEAWLTLDADTSAVERNSAETLAVAEVFSEVAAFLRNADEPLPIQEAATVALSFFRSFAEALVVSEGLEKSTTQPFSSLFTLAEQSQRATAFLRTQAETFGLLSGRAAQAFKGFAEVFAVSEALVWQVIFQRLWDSALSLSESLDSDLTFLRSFSEAFGIADSDSSSIAVSRSSLLAFAERKRGSITNVEPELLAFVETYSDFINWLQANAESFSIAEVRSTAISKLSLTLLGLREALLRNANGVYGDISIRNAAITLADFLTIVATRHPEGYSEMKQFLPGDYRFQNALIGIVTEPSNGSNADISVIQAKTTTDVQDLHDRGTSAVGTGGLTISFNRVYSVPPEVQVTVTAGASLAIPSISAITSTGFFVRLYQASNPETAVAGTVSWSAIGY